MANSKALYFAAILPPAQISEKIYNLKLEFKERFSASHALKLPAHLTLIPPAWLKNEEEKTFVNALETVINKQASFSITLKDFGHFGQRAIFINAIDSRSINELHQNLLQELTEFLPIDNRNKLHPHLTLATRDLTRENFRTAWEEFRNRKFDADFTATDLTLFKHNEKVWEVLKDIDFQGKG